MYFKSLWNRKAILLVICLIIGFGSAKNVSRRNAHHTTTETSARTGQDVVMLCGDDKPESIRRFWRKGYEVLSVASIVITNDERIAVINNSMELRISNVTLDDEGEYTCVVSKRPQFKHTYILRVKELICTFPATPLHGGVENNTMDEDGDTFHYGSKMKYYCDKGYMLIGATVRICADPYKGWTDEVPSCEPEFMARIKHRLDDIENKMSHQQPTSNKAVSLLENKVTTIETRVSALEGGSNFSSGNLDRIKDIDATLHRLRTAINMNIHRNQWEKLLHGTLASLGEQDGYLIAEYTWFVEDIDEKIAQHRAEKFKYLESRPFYTNIPGYRMKLHLYPDYDISGHMGVYAVLVRGEFDALIAWPFTSRYEVSLMSRDENDVPYDIVIPSKVPACNFDRPPVDNTIGCGFSQFLAIETLHSKKGLYLYDGGIVLRIMIYLNYT